MTGYLDRIQVIESLQKAFVAVQNSVLQLSAENFKLMLFSNKTSLLIFQSLQSVVQVSWCTNWQLCHLENLLKKQKLMLSISYQNKLFLF